MQNVERLSIVLPADMVRMMRAKVEEGCYASDSDLICEAVRLWQERELAREQRLAAIRAKIDEADVNPVDIGDEDVERHFEERFRRSSEP